MLEAEWRQVLQGSMRMGAKEDESSGGHVWAAGFYSVVVCSHLVGILNLTNYLYFF
jgi:hypothetical protein